MRNKFLKATAGIAAFAAVAAIAPFTPASAAPVSPFVPVNVPIGITPPNGNSSTTFAMSFPSAQFCPGDSTLNYRWGTFITPASEIAPATFTPSGSPIGLSTATTKELRTTAGGQIRAQLPGLGDGIVIPPIDVSFINLNFASLAANPGAYNIGIACTLAEDPDDAGPLPAVVNNKRFWTTPITITALAGAGGGAQGFTYAFGAAAAAPVLTTSSYNSGTSTATVNFTHAASVPATASYTATLVPVGAAAPIGPITGIAAGATSFQIPGVALGSSYTVTLTATNGTFTSVPSNSLTVVGAVTAPAPVVTAPDAFEGNALTVSWLAPASGPTPASYNVAITPGGPSFTAVAGLSQVIPAGLAIGGYTATVTPNYAVGSGVTGTAGSDTFSVTPNTLVVQEITVTRPPGALILTQRCGVYGGLPAFTAVDAFPGFPRTLAAEGVLGATTGFPGTSPDIDLVTPGVQVDPEFGNYPEPQPPTYPTECGLSMGTARFVTSGALAGQFYTASGRLNQVTVLDTRDTDTGWIARGDIETNFTGTTGNTFSGDYLGWTPQVTDTSDPVGGSVYDQLVTAGPQVLPGTTAGLTGNPILGESPVNAGLGIATMDARMKLLIPASANAADYSATLSLTVVPRP